MVCEGASVSYTDLSSNNPVSWSWTFDGGDPASSTEQNPVVTYASSGQYSVQLVVQNADGSDMIEINNYIQVFSQPEISITIQDESYSGAEDGSLTANTTGGVEPYYYNWSNAVSGSLNSNLPAGSYGVTVTDSIGCTDEAIASIGVAGILPDASFEADNETVCLGNTVNYTDLSTGNPSSYNWEFEGGTPEYSTDQNPVVTYNTAGTFNVTLVVSNSTGEDSVTLVDMIMVTELALDFDVTDESASAASDGSVMAIVTGGTEPYTYSWNNGDTGAIIDNLTAGTYSVVVIDASGCVITSPVTVSVATSLDEIASGVLLYPNPTQGFLTIQSDNVISSYQIIDITGKVLLNEYPVERNIKLDLHTLDNGMYIIKL
ncbi:MAG: hypothetical protein C0594_06590, partial [Marinilabiliales bacterium]